MCLIQELAGVDIQIMKNISTIKRTTASVAILVLCVAVPAMAAEQVTICHAAGQDDTTQFVTLTIAEQAAYGQAGHFNEDGTPRAGHENDYLGACTTDEGTTTTTTTAVLDETTTTTTAVLDETTTTTTAVLDETTTTTAQVNNDPIATTTTIQFDHLPSSDVAVLGITASNSASVAQASGTSTVAALAITELPFTGISTELLAAFALAFTAAGSWMLMWRRSLQGA